MAHVDSSFLWGNWTVYRPIPASNQAIWLADNAILVDNFALTSFDSFGQMRASLTAFLWQRLGLKTQYPKGWLIGQQTPLKQFLPNALDEKTLGKRFIIARPIKTNIIQCTCDETGTVVKQTIQNMYTGGRCSISQAPNFFDAGIAQETRDRSKILFDSLRTLCESKELIGLDGLRISWGITERDEVLTPIGGFGLPDHARYYLLGSGREHVLDRRFAKTELASHSLELSRRDSRACHGFRSALFGKLRSRYEACHASLMAN